MIFQFQEPKFFLDDKLKAQWQGKIMSWIKIELIVYTTYVLTLLFVVIKSRFWNISVDQKYQFMPKYLSMMINKIIGMIKINFYESSTMQEHHWTAHVQDIDFYGADLKIKLNKESFNEIFRKRYLKDPNVVSQEEAVEWMHENFPGGITKQELDDQRNKEIT